LAACFASAGLLAHGGAYRAGPPPTPVPANIPTKGVPGGPKTGGPAGPSAPAPTPSIPRAGAGPTTGAPASCGANLGPDEAMWQTWWELNKDPFVQQDTSGPPGPTTGSDDFYLGQRRTQARADTMLPSDDDLDTRVVPALVALLEAERNRDVQTACLMALGKIGRDAPGIDLEKVLSTRIARDDQEVRETAALALGVSGRAAALPLLLALLRNDAEGKRLCGREDVHDRTRAFAAYALGLLARRSDDVGVEQAAHDALWVVLRDKTERSRDLRVAAVNALGLLGDTTPPSALAPGTASAAAGATQATNKRLAWIAVEQLLAWYQQDLGAGDEAVQAHAPVAIGRLLGRGSSLLHQRCKQHFVATLLASNKRGNAILRSSALALGMLALPPSEHPDDATVAKALQAYFDKGVDRLARNFAVMAMGRIGGPDHRAWLLGAYTRANKNTERPWLALSLGLIAANGAAKGDVDATFARIALDDLAESSRAESRAALALAVGLTRHAPAVPVLQRLLREGEHEEFTAGYYCVALAMLGDRSSAPTLSAILERSKRRPFLLLQAAVGLGCLGDREANDRLLAMMKESESLAVLAALADAIGQIGDRRAIDPLVAMTKDEELTKLARAFVAAALGSIGERTPMPWNMPLSRDCNYAAAVDTLTNGVTGVLDIL
jgi:HEAT repeat protein